MKLYQILIKEAEEPDQYTHLPKTYLQPDTSDMSPNEITQTIIDKAPKVTTSAYDQAKQWYGENTDEVIKDSNKYTMNNPEGGKAMALTGVLPGSFSMDNMKRRKNVKWFPAGTTTGGYVRTSEIAPRDEIYLSNHQGYDFDPFKMKLDPSKDSTSHHETIHDLVEKPTIQKQKWNVDKMLSEDDPGKNRKHYFMGQGYSPETRERIINTFANKGSKDFLAEPTVGNVFMKRLYNLLHGEVANNPESSKKVIDYWRSKYNDLEQQYGENADFGNAFGHYKNDNVSEGLKNQLTPILQRLLGDKNNKMTQGALSDIFKAIRKIKNSNLMQEPYYKNLQNAMPGFVSLPEEQEDQEKMASMSKEALKTFWLNKLKNMKLKHLIKRGLDKVKQVPVIG